MSRHLPLALIALASLAVPAFGDGMDPAPPAADAPAPAPASAKAPALASDADAAAALVAFKESWKAKGLKGDERVSQRDWALDELSKIQHPLVVMELGGVAKTGEDDLKLIAVIYLARQKALAGKAGDQVVQAMQRNSKDVAFVLSALQTLGKLAYLGADDNLKEFLKSEDWAVRKYTITAVGQVGDMRLVDELLKILGVDLKNAPPAAGEDKKGGKEVVEEGYSWEGAEATVDHGDADNSKENAEAKAKAESQIAKNKAAAAGGAGGGGGGGVGVGGGGGGGRGGSARNPSELRPYVLAALKYLTGETFSNRREIHDWFSKNTATVEQKKKDCDVTEAAQRAEAKK